MTETTIPVDLQENPAYLAFPFRHDALHARPPFCRRRDLSPLIIRLGYDSRWLASQGGVDLSMRCESAAVLQGWRPAGPRLLSKR